MRQIISAVSIVCLIAAQVCCQPGGSTADVTTLFNLYGPSVEPWSADKEAAVKAAIVQAAGHGVTLDQVSLSVLATYANQGQSGRRLRADAQLSQPGVALLAVTQTTQPNAQQVSQAITSAISNGNIVNVYKSSGNFDATSASVVSSGSGSSSSNASPPNGANPAPNGNNGSNDSPASNPTGSPVVASGSGKGSKKGFPVWAAALVALLVILLVALVASYFIWRKCAATRELRNQDHLQGGGYPHSMADGSPSLVKLQVNSHDRYSDAAMSPHTPSPLDGFKGPMGLPITSHAEVGPVRPINRPLWANSFSNNPIMEDSIDEERPMDNPMLGGFSTTSSSAPAGASAPGNQSYMPYAPSRTGRLMSYMRGT